MHCNPKQLGCWNKNFMGSLKIQLTLNKKAWVLHCKLFFPCILWWMMEISQILLSFKTCILFLRFIFLATPPRRRKVWFHRISNMKLLLWRSIIWLNIQLLNISGKMLIQFLVQNNSVGKNPKINFMLIMGPSQLILGMLILIKKLMHNKRNSWRTFYYLLQKLTCLFVLWKISGWSTWSCVKIPRLCFQIKIKWFNMPSFHWGPKPWNNMWCQL
jgi:hypothetical protein